MTIHVVQAGESVGSIAMHYGVDPVRLAADNAVPADGALAVGQTLVVRFPRQVHAVQPGETLTSIAAAYGTSVRQLWRNNWPLGGMEDLSPGQVLVISYWDERLGTASFNGYAYPYIDPALLSAQLPYVTYLTPFTYGISAGGGLLPLEDDAMLSAAPQRGTAPVMHLSTLTESGQFDTQRAEVVLTDFEVQDRLVSEVLQTVLRKGFAGLERFVALMRTRPKILDKPGAKTLCAVRGTIDLRDVSFSYEEGETNEVLHHVTLHVDAGETIAIVGPSGGGKSTLCQLIPRFYDVTEGEIAIDGENVRDVTLSSLRRSIGIVQQDVFLFADTVRENIRYGRSDCSEEEIIEAAKRAEIYDDIMAMPQGFDTYVGERGTLLSGGQKQRISIARIFLKNPPILILDEATSALDSLTEKRIQHAFDELARGRTTLIIAHRLSTIRNASRILVIENGEIVEQGGHEELLAKNGAYAALWNTQNGRNDG